MTEKGVGKPWTTDEDKLLIQAVAIHGENDNWKAVAVSVPGRTNKACRKRWLHSLSPNVKKSAWTAEEDGLLLSLYATHGTKWSVIARQIPGRTDDACSKRYREALDPSLKRDDWTSAEDAKLLEAYSRLGGKWGVIGQELNRSGLGCRNRWRMLERRKIRSDPSSAVQGPSNPQVSTVHGQDSPFWDGRSPQYVAPSVLYQGSPTHAQESRATAYSPQQILSGAHLNGSSSHAQEPPPFQYLSTTPAHSSTVPTSTEAHEYYSGSFSPGHVTPALSDINVPPTSNGPRPYDPSDYDYMPIDTDHPEESHPGHYQPDASHEASHISLTERTLSTAPPGRPDTTVPSDSPASPSNAGSSSPPGSPIHPLGTQGPETSNTVAPADSTPVRRPYYRTEEEKARERAAQPQRTELRPSRLSSKLPATSDESVLAYACGHRDCWLDGATNSTSAFATSGALSEHSKAVHKGELGGSKPFRCGLEGCEKSWKSLNGLQYHLQISKYHFQQALAAHTNVPAPAGGDGYTAEFTPVSMEDVIIEAAPDGSGGHTPSAPPGEVPSPRPAVADIYKIKRKTIPCPHPGCSKQYKQVSGLRYHLTHGHADQLPAQLDVIPPALARIVKEKESASRD